MTGGVDPTGCTTAVWATLEVAGQDAGPTGTAKPNFELSDLILGPGSVAALVDLESNGNRGPGGSS